MAQKILLALIIVLGSSLLPSFSIAQAHDHGAMPTAVSADAPAQNAEMTTGDDHAQHAVVADPHAGHAMDSNVQADPAMATDSHGQHADPAVETLSHTEHVEPAVHDHGDMATAMDMNNSGSAQVGTRDPHAYSNGLKLGEGPYAIENYRLLLADQMRFGGFRMNRLEQLFLDGTDATEYDAQAWYGTSYDRLVLKAEGEVQRGSLEESNTELLWSHAVHSFWNTQIGVSNQTTDGVDRNWLALGIQGIAPYWFEIDATVYLGNNGRSAFNLEAEYDLLLTQRLIVQPRVEMNFYGKNDQAALVGSGLSDLSTGIRIQYQINRQLVPYVGVESVRQYGQTAKFSGVSSGDAETRWLAGLRFWF